MSKIKYYFKDAYLILKYQASFLVQKIQISILTNQLGNALII